MTTLYTLASVLTVIILYQGILLRSTMKQATEERRALMDAHHKERTELLDRIQAPTFNDYKSAEVRVIKAQKPDIPDPYANVEIV